MQILLTGGTGYIGAATLKALQASGHEVVAVVRSDESASTVADAGAKAVIGDLKDVAWLTEQLRGVEGAVHLATDNGGPGMDDAVVDAVIGAFGGTAKPFVHTSGVWIWGDGADLTEDHALNPPPITAWRGPITGRLLAADVKGTVIAPGIVYGYGQGIPSMLAGGPRTEDGALVLIGSGDQHWTTVHVDDLAELYVIALERSDGHQVYLGVGGDNPTVREIGQAIVGSGGSVVPGSTEEAHGRFGEAFADALLLDQQATGSKARVDLGWEPNARTLVQEYAATAQA